MVMSIKELEMKAQLKQSKMISTPFCGGRKKGYGNCEAVAVWI